MGSKRERERSLEKRDSYAIKRCVQTAVYGSREDVPKGWWFIRRMGTGGNRASILATVSVSTRRPEWVEEEHPPGPRIGKAP